jgi:membrane fusion protein (multidrug efflux system)
VLLEGEKIAGILPEGRLLAVAQFPPAAALGRIAPGQPAKIRLEGFPWAQWGAVPAVVQRVAAEVRDGAVRVELAIDPSQAIHVPLQHGLPGSVEVEVERTTPARLLLRISGKLLTEPRSSYLLER